MHPKMSSHFYLYLTTMNEQRHFDFRHCMHRNFDDLWSRRTNIEPLEEMLQIYFSLLQNINRHSVYIGSENANQITWCVHYPRFDGYWHAMAIVCQYCLDSAVVNSHLMRRSLAYHIYIYYISQGNWGDHISVSKRHKCINSTKAICYFRPPWGICPSVCLSAHRFQYPICYIILVCLMHVWAQSLAFT